MHNIDDLPDPASEPFIGYSQVYFSDRLFEGETRTFEIIVEPFALVNLPTTRFMLVISGLSEDLVKYRRTLYLQEDYLLGDPFFNGPIEAFSNIQGGLGVFAGFTNDTFRINDDGSFWEEDDVGFGARPIVPCPI